MRIILSSILFLFLLAQNAQSAVNLIPCAKSANYTITTNDGCQVINITTGASVIAITLPSAATNIGRKIKFVKVDSGTGSFTVTRAGADTIDELTTYTQSAQYATSEIIGNTSTSWSHVSPRYEFSSPSLTFSFNGGGGSSSASTLRFTRIGNIVTVRLPQILATTTNTTTSFTSGTGEVPVFARPLTATSSSLGTIRIRTNGVVQEEGGFVDINTAGTMTIYRDNSTTTTWAAGTSNGGVDNPCSFSYYVGLGS
jgi:hypothetical protein